MITNLQVKEDLLDFSKALQVVTHPIDPIEPNTQIFDMGLIVLGKDSMLNGGGIKSIFPEGTAYNFILDSENDYLLFSKAFFVANSEGRNLVVECVADPSPSVISALKDLSERNVFTMLNFNNAEVFSMPLNPKTRVMFCIKEDILENKITYPYFVDLFGPVIKIK